MIELDSEIYQLGHESMAIELTTKPTADDFLHEELTTEREKDADDDTSSELHDAVEPSNEQVI